MSEGYTNLELEQMAEALQPLLELNGIVGYTAARNMRLIVDEIADYLQMKERLLRAHGHEAADADGKPTGSYAIGPDDEGFAEFLAEFSEIANVRHAVEFYRLPAERCIGALTGRQFLDCSFMVEEESDG